MNYRNPKVLEEARDKPCQLCGKQDGSTVAAHSNQGRHGKGMGIKAHDCFVAYCCAACHSLIDQSKVSGRLRLAMWETAHYRSIPLFIHLLDDQGKALLKGDIDV